MYQIDFKHPVHVHFIGIGGISMSGLASVLLGEGFTVSGSDAKQSALTDLLTSHGAKIMYGQCAENIDPSTDVVVYTAAIHPDNPEYAAAVQYGIPLLTRAQLLGEIMQNYPMSVAVAGTHGKTTTTSMLSHIAVEAQLDPTISVGGILKLINGNIRVGHSQTFITEACEYTNSYHSLQPKVGIILNIDADHLDFFKDLDDIRASFRKFAGLIASDGVLVINGEIPHLEQITEGLSCKVIRYGTADSDYRAENITFNDLGFASFDLIVGSSCRERIDLMVPGTHNVGNALAAIAAADVLGADPASEKKALLSFTGTDRRFEHKGVLNGVTIIDDYAHHPTEIAATLRAAANYPHKRIICVFQPHTYTRTKALLQEFSQALTLADEVVLADIYAARETNTLGISSLTVANLITDQGGHASYISSFEAIESYLREHLEEGDLLITMGAGDVYLIGEHLLAAQ